jgi:hypothetical protein
MKKNHTVSLDSLPDFLSTGVMAAVGKTEVKSFGKIEAPIIKVEAKKDAKALQVDLQRAVFLLKVPKKDLLPAHGTAGQGGTFKGEQEVEGLEKFGYSNVVTAFPKEKLGRIDGTDKPIKPTAVPNNAPVRVP